MIEASTFPPMIGPDYEADSAAHLYRHWENIRGRMRPHGSSTHEAGPNDQVSAGTEGSEAENGQVG